VLEIARETETMGEIMTDASAQGGAAGAAAPGASAPATPPTNAAEAQAVLNTKFADKAWGAKLLSGDGPTTTEYRGLRELINKPDPTDAVKVAMSSDDKQGFIQDSSVVELRGAAGFLRDLGLNEQQVAETLQGKQPSEAEIQMAKAWKTQSFKSKEFVNRLFAGEPDARQQLLVANIILSSART
jgi:hypothetical protein